MIVAEGTMCFLLVSFFVYYLLLTDFQALTGSLAKRENIGCVRARFAVGQAHTVPLAGYLNLVAFNSFWLGG
jgi:hypothetical protein